MWICRLLKHSVQDGCFEEREREGERERERERERDGEREILRYQPVVNQLINQTASQSNYLLGYLMTGIDMNFSPETSVNGKAKTRDIEYKPTVFLFRRLPQFNASHLLRSFETRLKNFGFLPLFIHKKGYTASPG